ncbi:MAG: hypothetical protein IJT72_08440 [Lachnospiraceae bacterium]|nr:hypothetical protein [Lachnospiraceae bacterium]
MKQVKQRLADVTNILKAQMAEERNAFLSQLVELKEHYNQLLAACDHYLEEKWTAKLYFFGQAKARRNMVKALRDMAKQESDCLSGLSKDKNLFEMRKEGMLVGTAVLSALRDYRAAGSVKNLIGFKLENGYYTANFNDSYLCVMWQPQDLRVFSESHILSVILKT